MFSKKLMVYILLLVIVFSLSGCCRKDSAVFGDWVHDMFVKEKSMLKKRWVDEGLPIVAGSQLSKEFSAEYRGLYVVTMFTDPKPNDQKLSVESDTSFSITMSLSQREKSPIRVERQHLEYQGLGETLCVFRCPDTFDKNIPIRCEVNLNECSSKFTTVR